MVAPSSCISRAAQDADVAETLDREARLGRIEVDLRSRLLEHMHDAASGRGLAPV